MTTFFVGTTVVSEIDFYLGQDARCTLKVAKTDVPICGEPAAWACRLACCGFVKIVCAKHRHINRTRIFACAACKATAPAFLSVWPV